MHTNSSLNKIFSTNTNNTSLNMKIKNKTMEFSIYNCNDKDRLGNTRYEQRFTSLRGLDNFQNKILKSLNKYDKELCDLTIIMSIRCQKINTKTYMNLLLKWMLRTLF